jgi:hypothetical protein
LRGACACLLAWDEAKSGGRAALSELQSAGLAQRAMIPFGPKGGSGRSSTTAPAVASLAR